MSFSNKVGQFNDKAVKAGTKIFQKTSFDMFAKIMKRTPVDTGRARNNWQMKVNRAPRSILGGEDKSGSKALSQAQNETNKIELGKTVYIVNNLPYAPILEDGSSSQAPQGMVKITVAEFKNIVDKNADREKV